MELHKLPKRIQRFVMIIGDLMITSAKPIGITGTEMRFNLSIISFNPNRSLDRKSIRT